MDKSGKLITNQTANFSINQTFDTSDWAASMYLVNFATSEGVSSEKIIFTKQDIQTDNIKRDSFRRVPFLFVT